MPLGTPERAANLVDKCITIGTSHIHTHADIDLTVKHSSLEAVMEVHESYKNKVTIQIVAFPQSGVSRAPGTLELLEGGLKNGGGTDRRH